MSARSKSNFKSFLEHTSPNVSVKLHTKGSSSSSRHKAEEAHVVLSDLWSAYEEWSCYAVGVPLKLNDAIFDVTQHYAPTLSAIQIFTNKPFSGGSSSRSLGTDSHLYFEFNETASFNERDPLHYTVEELAKQHHGLNSLTTSDLSQDSWFSVAWSPVYPIPSVSGVKELYVSFLTYHSLTPSFPEPQERKVAFPAFGVVTTKLSGNLWNMRGTSDEQNMKSHEESAASWLGRLMFKHSDFDKFIAGESDDDDPPSPGGW